MPAITIRPICWRVSSSEKCSADNCYEKAIRESQWIAFSHQLPAQRFSEDKPRQQIGRIVIAGIAPASVVVGTSSIEARIAGVLNGQVDILHWPPGEVADIPCASGASIRAASDGGRRVERSVRGS